MKPARLALAITAIAALHTHTATAQLFDKIKEGAKKITSSPSSYTESEAASALREALSNGARHAVSTLSIQDGFFGNPLIKIPFPPEAKEMENGLRKAGLGSEVDKGILSLNRAAERASGAALDILVRAITKMTIADAVAIVRGDQQAATNYLRRVAGDEIRTAFSPIVAKALNEVDATRLWADLAGNYNKIPFVKKVNPDLERYVTDKAIDALFLKVAEQEKEIRSNPSARVTDMLKKVFGS